MTTHTTARKPVITADVYGSTLTLTFSDGRELVINADNLNDTIRTDAMLHGLKQKLVDAAAIARNTDTGRSATLDDKFDAVNEVFMRITSPDGTWNKARGGEGTGNAGLLVRAIMRLQDKPKAEVEAWLATKTKEQKEALRKNPRVIDAIAAIQRESVRDTAATDAMLDELSGE